MCPFAFPRPCFPGPSGTGVNAGTGSTGGGGTAGTGTTTGGGGAIGLGRGTRPLAGERRTTGRCTRRRATIAAARLRVITFARCLIRLSCSSVAAFSNLSSKARRCLTVNELIARSNARRVCARVGDVGRSMTVTRSSTRSTRSAVRNSRTIATAARINAKVTSAMNAASNRRKFCGSARRSTNAVTWSPPHDH